MPLTNYTNKNYTLNANGYQLKLPFELEGFVPHNDSVRLLSQTLEGLDYTRLYQAYSTKGRKPAVDPKTMFKILVYAYSQNIFSSHKIETACRRDINFMWLLEGQKAPDHSTIARFRQGYAGMAVEELLYQQIRLLYEMEEIPLENMFVDGTKIEANANRYTFVWKKAVAKNEIKMHEKIKALVTEINLACGLQLKFSEESAEKDLTEAMEILERECQEKGIVFVYGKGKRPTQLQKYYEKMHEYQSRQQNYDKSKNLLGDRNSYSKTDPDATCMHMKDDHMRNSQLKPGYNVQIGVEAEYIIGVGVYSDRNDTGPRVPFLKELNEHLPQKPSRIIADSGYESEEIYMYLEQEEQQPYIKPQTYEKWKKRSFKQDISKRENMKYNEETDEYTCHNGKQLKAIYTTRRTAASGYTSERTVYECENCEGCPYKQKCTRAVGNRKMKVSKKFIEKRKVSYENIMSEEGIKLRVNRSNQVEGAFGVLKNDYGFTRFLTRGKPNGKTEFLFLCLGYNINKLHSKIQAERCLTYLYNLKETA